LAELFYTGAEFDRKPRPPITAANLESALELGRSSIEKNFRPCGSVLCREGSITRKRKQKYVWLDKRIQNCSQLLEDGELSILEFPEVAQNFTYNTTLWKI
jgi:hypothetical protein